MDQIPSQLSPEEIKQACVVHYFVSQLGGSERWRHGHLLVFSTDAANRAPVSRLESLKNHSPYIIYIDHQSKTLESNEKMES